MSEVNGAVRTLLRGREAAAWDGLLEEFAQRNAFQDHPYRTRKAEAFLSRFGGRRLVHDHTPIGMATGQAPKGVMAPLEYADGLCVNVDAGLYLGGPGFVYAPGSIGEPVNRQPRQG